MPTLSRARLRGNADALRWQSRIRIAVACVAAIGELLLLAHPDPHPLTGIRPAPFIMFATLAYCAVIAATAWHSDRRGRASPALVLLCALADVAFLFAMVAGVSEPAYLDRVLVFGLISVYLTTVGAGRRYGGAAAIVVGVAYAGLATEAIASGTTLQWREELWSLALFGIAASIIISEQGSLAARLTRIDWLLSRAEEGDFSHEYDEHADRRTDAIARVGRAYNRVRLQLASMVLTDPLTGCLNRRGFDLALAREVARATRSGGDLALVAVDIDHFKAVNDTLGHPAGDVVLRDVGALLRHVAREGDLVARTGGEEFCLVLPDTSASGALHLADRLCAAMRAHHFGDRSSAVPLTVSVGVAAADHRDRRASTSVAEALKGRADEALYAAKRSGRNRARIWASTEPEQLDLGVTI